MAVVLTRARGTADRSPHRQDHNHGAREFPRPTGRSRRAPPIEIEIGLSLSPDRGTHPADPPHGPLGVRRRMDALWVSPSATPRSMKNFARLVRFAWPYRVRFGLSIACAAMVALLFFAELGAVYPLLQILFNSENPQKWVAEKIESFRDDIAALEARQVEVRVRHRGRTRGARTRQAIAQDRVQRSDRRARAAGEQPPRRRSGDAGDAAMTSRHRPRGPRRARPARGAAARLSHRRGPARRAARTAARCCARPARRRSTAALVDIRQGHRGRPEVAQSLPRLAQPYVNRYLPGESFTALVLLIGLVMLGRGAQGLLHVPPGSPGRRRDAAHPLRHPQPLLPPDDQPGPRQLLRPGLRRADGAVHQRHGFVRPGPQHPDEQADPRADADRDLPGLGASGQLAADLPDADPGADLRRDHLPRRQDHEAGRPPVAREHVHDLQDPPGDLPGDQGRQGVHHGAGASAGGSSARPRTSTRRASGWR